MGVIRHAAIGLVALVLLSPGAVYLAEKAAQTGLWPHGPVTPGTVSSGEIGAVVVLGGGPTPNARDATQNFRLAPALELLETQQEALLVLTGQISDNPIVEPLVDGALRAGIPRERIVVEDRSTSTFEDIRFILPRIEAQGVEGRTILVTDSTHMSRALALWHWFSDRPVGYALGDPTSNLEALRRHWRAGWRYRLREAAAWWYNLYKVAAWEAMRLAGVPEPARAEIVEIVR